MNSITVHDDYAQGPAGSPSRLRGSFALGHLFVVPLIFLAAFAVPILIAFGIGGTFSGLGSALRGGSAPSDQVDKIFPEALPVTSQGTYLRVDHAEGQLPTAGKDFALISFFSLKKLPAPGEKLIIYSKYEGTPQPRDGYALALMNESGAYRPMVFWGSKEHGGKWFNFPEIQLETKHWMLFSLSFQRGRFLGLHYGVLADPASEEKSSGIKLLGGYDVTDMALPGAKVPLVAGAVVERAFRGFLGPLAIVSEAHLADELTSDLKQLLEEPLSLEENFSSESLKLWIPAYSEDLPSEVQVFKKGSKMGARHQGKQKKLK